MSRRDCARVLGVSNELWSPAHGRASGLNAATGASTYTAGARFPGDSCAIKGSN